MKNYFVCVVPSNKIPQVYSEGVVTSPTTLSLKQALKEAERQNKEMERLFNIYKKTPTMVERERFPLLSPLFMMKMAKYSETNFAQRSSVAEVGDL